MLTPCVHICLQLCLHLCLHIWEVEGFWPIKTTHVYTFWGWRDFAPFCFHFFGGGGGSGVNGKAPCVHLCLQLCLHLCVHLCLHHVYTYVYTLTSMKKVMEAWSIPPAHFCSNFWGVGEGGDLMVRSPAPFFLLFLGVGESGGLYFWLTLHLCWHYFLVIEACVNMCSSIYLSSPLFWLSSVLKSKTFV